MELEGIETELKTEKIRVTIVKYRLEFPTMCASEILLVKKNRRVRALPLPHSVGFTLQAMEIPVLFNHYYATSTKVIPNYNCNWNMANDREHGHLDPCTCARYVHLMQKVNLRLTRHTLVNPSSDEFFKLSFFKYSIQYKRTKWNIVLLLVCSNFILDA